MGGHAEAVTHAVFGPNEQTVITASRDGTIRIWDTVLVSGEKRIRELPGAPSERPVDSGRPPTADPAAREEAAPPSELTADDQDFSYYPPGVLKGEGRGRVGDRYVYLPHDIVFPVEVPPGAHAYMNSQIFGAGGGGWGGRGVIGGTECDPGNYDRHRNRDNYCEVRGWKMPLCPTGSGHQGQDIRPPTCVASKWWAVAVSDGIITRVTSNTTVVLKADDGTDYMYLSLDPSTIGVRVGDRVRKGDRLGRVSNFLGGRRATTLHLHFQARRAIRHEGKVILTDVPVYTSLIAAYRRMKGLDDLIDANGNLGVDPEREIDPETDRPFAQSSDGEQRVREVVERADPGRLRETFPTPQDLVDRAKRLVPRCLGPKQREAFYLAPEPDRWCITGPGREAERDPAKWQPKWPYDSPAWRDWLVGRDRGEEPKMPQDNAG